MEDNSHVTIANALEKSCETKLENAHGICLLKLVTGNFCEYFRGMI